MRITKEIYDLLKPLKETDMMEFAMAVAEVTDEEALAIAKLPLKEANEFRVLLGLPTKSESDYV